MKKFLVVLSLMLLAVTLTAQVRTGNVYGKITDTEGNPLPGVSVTLKGGQMAPLTTVTGETGIFRFPALGPGSDYELSAELTGFKKESKTGIIVTLGSNVEINLALTVGTLEEQVTVIAQTPVVDVKKTTVGQNVNKEMMQSLPTARDPWVVMQLAPSIMVDRENVGGNESSEQSHFVTRGDNTNGIDNTWIVDGIDVSDSIALGLSDINYDFDAIDTLSVTTGGAADVTQQTSGIAVNLLTRRGGNKIAGTARFFLTDHAFQSDNLTTALRSKGVPNTNKIQQIRDFGASVGGPLVKDRIWAWLAYGVQDLFAYTIYDFQDRTLFDNYNFKLNIAPFAGNRVEALFTTSQKERFGVNADPSKPEGDHQTGRFRLGSPIFKFQDEQVIGNSLYLSAKFTWTNTGTTVKPMVDEDLTTPVTFDVGEGVYVPFSTLYGRSWDYSRSIRANKNVQFAATLFRDDFLGMSHEIKAGLEFADKKVTSVSGFAQNYEVFRNFTDPLIDLGEGLVVPPSDWQRLVMNRDNRQIALASQSSGYLQDTITKGRFALQLGLRYDYQKPSLGAVGISTTLSSWSNVFTQDAATSLGTYLPPLTVNAVSGRYQWSTWSPRVGFSWDLKGDGRTVLKLALAQYGDVLAAGANVPRPLGLTGNMAFWWNDTDADSLVDRTEIYWEYSAAHATTPNQLYALFTSDGALTEAAAAALVGGFESDAYLAGNFSGFDWNNRTAINYDNLTTFYRSDVDPATKNVKTSPRTREIMLSLEKELRTDLAASVGATFRRYDNFDWAKLFYPADIYPSTPDLVIDNTGTWFTVAGTIPATVKIGDKTIELGDAAGRPWYLPVASFPGDTPYRMVDKSSSYRTYVGLDLALTKRLSHRWFLNASVTLQDQRTHWGDSFIDPTNQWAIDGKPYGNWGSGAGGKVQVQMYSRWMAKLSGLYQLPWGFDVAATFQAREGWKIPNYLTLAYANSSSWPGLYRANTIYIQTATKDSLPMFSNLTFRLEKRIALGSGRMYLMADVFNALNSAVVNRSYDAYSGTYYVDTEASSVNPFNRLYNEILNPRVWRLGLRFEF